jgi:hypothetical protein
MKVSGVIGFVLTAATAAAQPNITPPKVNFDSTFSEFQRILPQSDSLTKFDRRLDSLIGSDRYNRLLNVPHSINGRTYLDQFLKPKRRRVPIENFSGWWLQELAKKGEEQ